MPWGGGLAGLLVSRPFFWGSVLLLNLRRPRSASLWRLPPGPCVRNSVLSSCFLSACFPLCLFLSVLSCPGPPALPGPVGLPSACEGLLLQDNTVSAEIRALLSSYYSDR